MAEALTLPIGQTAAPRPVAGGCTSTLAVPDMHCGGCMRKVETALAAVPGVISARANLSAKRVLVVTREKPATAEAFLAALREAGFAATPLVEAAPTAAADANRMLLRCLGVAGFAAANIMLLSVSVWSGHGGDMPASMKAMFHWLSAAIALPAVAYAGRPFFTSARTALRSGRLNMDVPISVGVILATVMSLYQTMRGSEQIYFDAAVTLLFFLLVGRVLDQRMRQRAAGAAENLLGLRSPATSVLRSDGSVERIATTDVVPGLRVLVAAGERIPVDARLVKGVTTVDESLITGESVPRRVEAGEQVYCGTINLGAPVELEATAVADNTLLAEIGRLMSTAEQARGRYVRLADRAARVYAPAVHVLGLATCIGWLVAGFGWEPALTAAIAVLIITCPCALALAVPAVQVVATSRLFRSGIVMKSADGLERLAEVDTIVLDKTGTLTRGEPRLAGPIDDALLARAAALAVHSRHPYAQALVKAARERALALPSASDVVEHAGEGLTGQVDGRVIRVGSARFSAVDAAEAQSLYITDDNGPPIAVAFSDSLRPDVSTTVRTLAGAGYRLEILSGDRREAVRDVAEATGIAEAKGEVTPAGKIARIAELDASGRKVLMIGDGLNDAPALAAGHASLSPASATDISQTAADAIFQGERLAPVIEALAVAKASQRKSIQNFAIAIGYNIVFVPLAVIGLVTPLIAAIAMSASSIAVTANALRLARQKLELAR